ncbi:glutamine synthetase III family protein [Chryseobacterium taklimakanense]|uniref:Glutamine synthetase type III n=1 Tax=Chryseobacterium taklimakanense TaxID=536441 RepID=A0A3G8WZM7_9FLAO|nr:glutamine synthetase III [Chryseobacterium taklimakanense]AZI21236.1 glutamine synthetase type III [Chryseobacterium taklimakanense]
MSTLRFKALAELPFRNYRKDNAVEVPKKLSELFCENVFSEETMRAYLTKEAFTSIQDAIKKGSKTPRNIADQIAVAMKDWALSKGATHYTHWFQPLTGSTAEKHDSFFTPFESDRAIERFNGGMLIQQEPDASSFPNGGIRNTFEARGYTAWDPTSPAFIIGTTLCIPSIFISYTGEALDYKTPLLRALSALDDAATDVCKSYFDKNVTKVTATLGWEQEYFLVDSALYQSRPDLVFTGRTLLGHSPAKGQQLDDHYFGSIPTRVMNFMKELEIECMKLGIPVTTRHNEVAPNQFELAPMFEETNVAVDHNSLLMDIMARVAHKHHFHILFHEKPFKGVNGSGKHNNWSMATDTGENLLSPGKNPKKNLQFLTFFVNSLKAVYEYSDLLRASIATANNDHRLGANEAPPAIISAFIGSQLYGVLEELEKVTDGKLSPEEKTELKLNVVGKIPEILLDNTDRNRTSPFAFTGNKFEFRAVGSSSNCAGPMTVLNAIMAKQLRTFKGEVDDLIENKNLKKDEAIFNVLREYIKDCKSILFEGDGYSEDWANEAAKRGLNNLKTTPEALKSEMNKKFIELYEELGIYTKRELEARNEVKLEKYSTTIDIEAKVLSDIARNHIIPAALNYQNRLIDNVKGLKEIFGDKEFEPLAREQMDLIKGISANVAQIKVGVDELLAAKETASKMHGQKQAEAYCNDVKPRFDKIREASDALEMMVDDELWPMTKYRELLFTR